MSDSASENQGEQPAVADSQPPADASSGGLMKLIGIVAILAIGGALFWWNLSRQNALEQQAKEAIDQLGGLTVLDAGQTHVESLNLQLIKDEKAIQEVMQWVDKLPHLKILDLSKTAVGDDDLATVSALGNLNSLHLNETKITNGALRHVTSLSQLQGLHLGGTGVTDEAFPQILTLQKLIHLDLSQTAVGPGVAQLAQLGSLKWLLLREVPLDPPLLAALEKLTQLQRLTVSKELVDSEPMQALKVKLPELTID